MVWDFERPLTEVEVRAAVLKLLGKKSVGLDGISAELLRDASDAQLSQITSVFNEILGSGDWPVQWKTDLRTPLFKKSDRKKCDNYRFIAINSVFRKLFCKIIDARLRATVDTDD